MVFRGEIHYFWLISMISECEQGTKVSNVKKSNTKLYAYHFAAFFKSSQPWSLNLSVSEVQKWAMPKNMGEVQKWAMPKSDQIQLKTSCISFRSIFQISPWFYNFSVSEVQKRAMQKKWSNSTRDFMRREPYLVTSSGTYSVVTSSGPQGIFGHNLRQGTSQI